MDDIELETRSMVDEGAELKHGVTCLRSRPIENSLIYLACDPSIDHVTRLTSARHRPNSWLAAADQSSPTVPKRRASAGAAAAGARLAS